jgi:hypothetical protein
MIRTQTMAVAVGLLLLLASCGTVTNHPPAVWNDTETGEAPDETPSGGANTQSASKPVSLEEQLETSIVANSAEDILPAAATRETGRPEEAAPAPALGKITFALETTPEFEPVVPGFFFTRGITQVHALFEYQGMSQDDTWERAWYLNDVEIARISEPWTGSDSGVFDYYVDNNGDPLPPGDYILALYVNRDLQQLGVFVIDDAPAARSGP